MRSRRIVISLCLVCVLFFVGDRLGGTGLSRSFMTSKLRFAQIYSSELSADIAFIGNSRGVHMFHPPAIEEATGRTVANLSFNSMPATLMPVLWDDYLTHHSPPRQLFIEVTCVGRKNEKGSLERFTVLQNRSHGFSALLYEENTVAYWATQLSHLYRFNSELMWRSLIFRKRSDQDWIMESVVPDTWTETYTAGQYRTFEKSQRDAAALKRMIDVAQTHGVEVKLILAPYLPEYYKQLEPHQEWLEWLEEELQQPILDYSAEVQDRELFADPIHLNPAGAQSLAKSLVQQGDIISADSDASQ